ncbi:MAG: aminotransferase class I/II-fold pyridoxal phosphate-dependent enzyme [Bacteroidales bacterium]|nr:aminotransferase class I/II-fold pyridoxal phosphate-dependent enzyme [Bacteroidales bacterium]
MLPYIDLRSDTVTHPTNEMRQAMANAVVGDDMMQEDPTVNELQKLSAEMLGKEDALFVPSGVFGNQLALFTHCNRGDEVVISNDSHPVQHEAGAPAIIAGVNMRIVTTEKQWFSWDEITQFIRFEEDLHFPKTSLIWVQNSLGNGDVWPLDEMRKIYENAQKFGFSVHLDGARIFNAATYLNVEAKEIAKYSDSVMFCLSKGLAAPIGSMLVGTKEFIAKARYKRKIMGGAMRQVGVLAAPGLISLQEMTKRLHKDHENASKLAEAFAKYDDVFDVNIEKVKTNMFFLKLKIGERTDFLKILGSHGILTYPKELGWYRFVTHKDITDENVNFIISKLPDIVEKLKR